MSSAAELPVGTVTFLFTDIEGSTQLLKRLGGESYGRALADHQRILREAFAENGGHEIDTQGDSFFVAFRRAKDAVAAAIACQQRLAKHPWRAEAAGASPGRTHIQPGECRLRLEAGAQLPVQPAVGRAARPALGEVNEWVGGTAPDPLWL